MVEYERSVLLSFHAAVGDRPAGVFPVKAGLRAAAFDPVWNGEAIFHDVFEHWHEGEPPYFNGQRALNLSGEMAASGALYYYYSDLGLQRFGGSNSSVTAATAVFRNTRELLLEAWTDGMRARRPTSICPNHGLVLRSDIPPQVPPSMTSQLDAVLEEYWQAIEAQSAAQCSIPVTSEVALFRESVTRGRIFDLHRWGWHEARRGVPLLNENRDRLSAFIVYWNQFCDKNSADQLMDRYRTIRVNIRHAGGPIRIEMALVNHAGLSTLMPGWEESGG
jgi:hypothetical protein